MTHWEHRRSLLINSTIFFIAFLGVYLLTSVAMGFALALIAPLPEWIFVIICNAFMLIMVWTKFSEMKEGIDYVMGRLGAIEINQFNQNPIVSRYLQVVTEMSIAAGIPVPKLFILPSYDINAFAISTGRNDTAIAITEGSITRLTRSELQALVGHEISHILHRDPILNFKLIGWLFGLQSIYLYGYSMFGIFTRHAFGDFDIINRFCLGYTLRTIGSGDGKVSESDLMLNIVIVIFMFPVIVLSLLIMCVGAIGAIVARMLKALISRQREYLADAESVRFVRGRYIVQVLEKIAFLEGDDDNHKSTAFDATHQEFSHFYLQNYQVKRSIFDTHPPILHRIKKIQPTYRAPSHAFIERLEKKFVDAAEQEDSILVSALHSYSMSRLTDLTHNIQRELGLDKSSQLVFMRLAKCYATFIATDDSGARLEQMEYLKKHLSNQLYNLVVKEAHSLVKLTELQRLQILTKELPSFDGLAKFQIQEIESICQALIDMDNQVTLSEYCMMLIVKVHISKVGKTGVIEYNDQLKSISALEQPIARLLSVTMAIVFEGNVKSAENCYADICEFLKISVPYQSDLQWSQVYDDVLPIMADLSAADQAKFESVFIELNKLPKISMEGRCILFILQRAFNFLY